jgi:putative addiction module killer protein
MAMIRTTEVFDRWFAGLRDREARARIEVRIRRLSTGNPGKHRNLSGGVAEMKIDHGPGYRVYYVTRAGITYILLCGGDKDSQQSDIDTALALAQQV